MASGYLWRAKWKAIRPLPSQKTRVSKRGQKTCGVVKLACGYAESFNHTRLAQKTHSDPQSQTVLQQTLGGNNETLKTEQGHSHKMAHASMPSAKSKLGFLVLFFNEKTRRTEQKQTGKK